MTISITALRALLAAGTRGPWRWGDWSAVFGTVEDRMLTLERNLTRLDDPTPYKTTRADGRYQVLTLEAGDSWGSNGPADAALITAAVNALPELLDEVERLRAAVEQSKSTFIPAHLALDMAKVLKLVNETARLRAERDQLRALVEEACERGCRLAEHVSDQWLIADAGDADRLDAIRAEAQGAK